MSSNIYKYNNEDFKNKFINVEIINNFEQYLIFTLEIMKIFTTFCFSIFFHNSYSQTSNKQKAALKKLESFGCKFIQDAQGKSAYQCNDAPKSLIKYYTLIVKAVRVAKLSTKRLFTYRYLKP